jgi:cytochrome c biogenesis protein CcmG, thiol:disulfide interchange protein DsbE
MSLKKAFRGLLCGVAATAVALLLLPQPEGIAAESREPLMFAAFFGFGSDAKAPAVDFELPSLNGSMVRLSKFKGERPVLIYFWATWCPYCVAMRPDFIKLREKVGPSEMEILGINVGGSDSLERLKRYQEGHPVSWPILYDGDGKVMKAYKVQGIPLVVLVDKEGNVVYRENELPSDVRKYLR